MALDPNEYQNRKLNYHDRSVSPSNFPRNSGPESHRWFSPQDLENKDFHGKDLGMSDASFASVGFADLSDRGVLKERNRNNFGSRERKSHDSGRESHYLFTPQDIMKNKGFHGKELGNSDASFASVGHGDLSDRGVLKERNRNSFGSRERNPHDSGRESHCLFTPQENTENKVFHAKELGNSDASFRSVGHGDLSDQRVLTERNRAFFESRERESHNSGTHYGSLSYGDHSKHHRIRSETDLTGFESDLGFIYKSNSNSNRSIERTFQDVGCDFKSSTIASEENFDNKSILETGSRPLCRVASEGNLNELEYKFKLGSNLERRSVSPKVRTSLAPKRVSDLSETMRCRCVCELSDRKDTQTYLSPSCGLYFSPNRNPSSNRPKPSYTQRMEYLSPRHRCLCYKSKSHKRDANSSHSLQEKIIQQSLSDELERKGTSATKGNSGLSKICKCAIFCVLLVIVFLFAPKKEISFLRSKFGAWNSSLEINHTYLFLNRVGMGSNHSEVANSQREIEPSIGKEGSCRGEMEKEIKSLTLNKNAPTQEVQTLEEKPNFTELPEDEKDGHEELESESIDEFTKSVHVPDRKIGYVSLVQADTKNIVDDREVQTHEELDFTEFPEKEKDGHEDFQSESEDKSKIDAKRCEVLDFTADRLERPVPIPDRKVGSVSLIDTEIKVEDRKVEMRIRFCMAFISVVVLASVVSCIIKRKQFGEMLHRYSLPKKGGKSSKKQRRRENSVILEGSYGSIVTYEKLPAKKRGGQEDGLLTPVRRSSRIRNYIASPS